MWHVKLNGCFSVLRDGKEIGSPPNSTVEALLIGLLFQEGHWLQRSRVAELLYPNTASSANAFRQSLFRLRNWLGDGCIEQDGYRIRLVPSAFTHEYSIDGDSVAAESSFAGGATHAWVRQIRVSLSRMGSAVEGEDFETVTSLFFQSVFETSKWDKDVARELLVGGRSLTSHLNSDELGTLLENTAPRDRRDPFVAEHRELLASNYLKQGEIRRAIEQYSLAAKLARHQSNWGVCYSTGAMKMLSEIESGNFIDATETYRELESIPGAKSTSLIMVNAQACFLWNQNHLDRALAVMRSGIRKIDSAGRAERLHFFSNYALLCAEAEQIQEARTAMKEVDLIRKPYLDHVADSISALAQAMIQLQTGDVSSAQKTLLDSRHKIVANRNVVSDWYTAEILAECYATKGDAKRAQIVWNESEKARQAMGLKLTPRVRKRKERIRRLLSAVG
jgi:DNA-binding SARP family transcriptional activator